MVGGTIAQLAETPEENWMVTLLGLLCVTWTLFEIVRLTAARPRIEAFDAEGRRLQIEEIR